MRNSETDGRQQQGASTWRRKYGQRHKLCRVTQFPAGVREPKRVRIYSRQEHFVLQWWEPGEKRTLSERVDDDLIAAIYKAREIDDRLASVKSSGRKKRIRHVMAVAGFLKNLENRADAGEIDVATVSRYTSSLTRHYIPFTEQPEIQRQYPHLGSANREFRQAFAAFLNNRSISPNGHTNATPRVMKSQRYVLDVARALYQWAIDAGKGALLPEGFTNPFADRPRQSTSVAFNPMRQLDINEAMAIDLVGACNVFQLSLFAPLLLFGLRPGELGWLLTSHISDGWVKVACIPELDYVTKGRRDKQFPVPAILAKIWQPMLQRPGLLYRRLAAENGETRPVLANASLAELVESFEERRRHESSNSAAARRNIRDGLMKEAGQLRYQHIKLQFTKLATQLGWPPAATIKDLRHLFSTSLENAGVPEFHRRYLMGQSFGKAPIVAYTHILKESLKEHFKRALNTSLSGIVQAIVRRFDDLSAEEAGA